MKAPRRAAAAAAACLCLTLSRPGPARGGAVEVKPYGFVLASYTQSWGRPNAVDVPTIAASNGSLAAGNQNTSAFSARQSRLGLSLSGGKGPGDSDLSGAVEADFFGLRNTGSSSADVLASSPRLRLAYLQAKRGEDVFVFGQDWDKAFAPLSPASLLHLAVPSLSNSGNLWNRLPQLRWDRTWKLGAEWSLGTKLALVRSFSADETGRVTTAGGTTFAVPTAVDSAGSGEFSGGPAYQALAQLERSLDGRPLAAGVSLQYVRETFNAAAPPPAGAGTRATGMLYAAHFDIPIPGGALKPSVSGEAFFGRGDQNSNGLGSFYNDLGAARLSQTRGGWAQLGAAPFKGWRFHAAAGFESLDQTGLATATIYRDETMTLNAIWDVSPELSLSAEAGRIHSYYVNALRGDSENAGLAAQYRF
jgi:hypothetical protein